MEIVTIIFAFNYGTKALSKVQQIDNCPCLRIITLNGLSVVSLCEVVAVVVVSHPKIALLCCPLECICWIISVSAFETLRKVKTLLCLSACCII